MIQRVKRFEPHLQINPLSEVEVLLLASVESIVKIPGPVAVLRGRLPKVPLGCSAKAAVLNHSPVLG